MIPVKFGGAGRDGVGGFSLNRKTGSAYWVSEPGRCLYPGSRRIEAERPRRWNFSDT